MVKYASIMTRPEEMSYNTNILSVEAMQQALLDSGWEHSVDESVGMFTKKYAQINPLVAGEAWRGFIGSVPKVLQERAPLLEGGFAIQTSHGNTDLEISLFGKLGRRGDVTKVYVLDAYLRESGFEEIDPETFDEWNELKVDAGEPQPGTKEHYEQDPRAAKIRLLAIHTLNCYVRDILSQGDDEEALGELLEANRQLTELGVEPGMRTGEPRKNYMDPVVRAEWVAGAIRESLARGYGLSGNARALIAEHNISPDDEVIMVSSKSPAARDMLLLSSLEQLAYHLDPDAE